MRRSPAVRLAALLTALLVSLTTPGLALAHGLVHEHLATDHASDAAGGHPEGASHGEHGAHDPHTRVALSPEVEAGGDHAERAVVPRGHDHQHGHPTVAMAVGGREPSPLDLPAAPAVVPEPPAMPTAPVVVRSAALTDLALLARPAPESGPPPKLRAPPVR